MRLHRRLLAVLLLTAGACFASPDESSLTSASGPIGPLLLRDHGGAAFGPLAAPRDPVLVLPLRARPASLPTAPARLVRGRFEPSFASQLSTARPGAALSQRIVPLGAVLADGELQLRPERTLERGSPYTLLWLGAEPPQALSFTTSDGPASGARLVDSWPSDGATVPPNFERALLRFDGYLAGELDGHVVLRDETGAALATRVERLRCSELALPEGDCVLVTPLVALGAASRGELGTDGSLRSSTGAPLPATRASFTLAALPDHASPQLLATRCATDEQALDALCVRRDAERLFVRGNVDESALVSLQRDALRSATLSYAGSFELSLALGGDDGAQLSAVDLAGNTSVHALVAAPTSALACLRIDEVLANPRGKEPAQEWVELLNCASTPVSLMGFTLTTDALSAGRMLASPSTLAPGERALVVGPDFDPRDASDGELPRGVRLLPADAALSIGNGAETLFLRDPQGRRVSVARAQSALVAGQCSARLGGDDLELDPRGTCTPGTATFTAP